MRLSFHSSLATVLAAAALGLLSERVEAATITHTQHDAMPSWMHCFDGLTGLAQCDTTQAAAKAKKEPTKEKEAKKTKETKDKKEPKGKDSKKSEESEESEDSEEPAAKKGSTPTKKTDVKKEAADVAK